MRKLIGFSIVALLLVMVVAFFGGNSHSAMMDHGAVIAADQTILLPEVIPKQALAPVPTMVISNSAQYALTAGAGRDGPQLIFVGVKHFNATYVVPSWGTTRPKVRPLLL